MSAFTAAPWHSSNCVWLCARLARKLSFIYLLHQTLTNISLPQKQHIIPDTLTFTYVHNIPGAHSSAAFTSKTSEVCYGSELAYDAELATPFQALLIIPATLEEISTGFLYFCYSAEPYREAGSACYEHRKPRRAG